MKNKIKQKIVECINREVLDFTLKELLKQVVLEYDLAINVNDYVLQFYKNYKRKEDIQ